MLAAGGTWVSIELLMVAAQEGAVAPIHGLKQALRAGRQAGGRQMAAAVRVPGQSRQPSTRCMLGQACLIAGLAWHVRGLRSCVCTGAC